MSLDDLDGPDFTPPVRAASEDTFPPRVVDPVPENFLTITAASIARIASARKRIAAALDEVGVLVHPQSNSPAPTTSARFQGLVSALTDEVNALNAQVDRLEHDLVVQVQKSGPPARRGWVRVSDRVFSPMLTYGRTTFGAARMPEGEVVLTKAEIEAW